MNKLRNTINKIVEVFSVVLIAVMVLLVLWQVFARYILNNPSTFSETLTKYLFVWLVLVTSTYAYGSREHMRIEVLNNRLKGSALKAVNIAIECITIVFSAAIMVFGGAVITAMQMVQIDASLHIPMGIVYSIIPICGVITVFYCICNIVAECTTKKEAV